MKFYGDLNLNDNQAQQAVLEVESSFPLTPVIGRVTFKDKRVWICVRASGTPLWVPLGQPHDTYVHTQAVSSSLWTVQHDFDTTTPNPVSPVYPLVQVYDASGSQIIPHAVYYIDDSTINVALGEAATGTVVCMYGDETYYSGLITPQYAYEYTQQSAAATWVVRHWLGYVPIVRVFTNAGEEILPASVVADDAFQVTITFTTPTAGTVKMV